MERHIVVVWITLCLPGILSATCSSNLNFLKNDFPLKRDVVVEKCVHGICSEADICECNPCWSGPTCQDYVDKFSPRFLASSPYFILSSSPNGSWSSGMNNFFESNRALFRIESSDDDLGLTCQLGQSGPSATCPCATPRYSVIGSSGRKFVADPETGDVFTRPGVVLRPQTHYYIQLQVSGLKVEENRGEVWRERILVTLYTKLGNLSHDENSLEVLLNTHQSKNEDIENFSYENDEDNEEDEEKISKLSQDSEEESEEISRELNEEQRKRIEKIRKNSVFTLKSKTRKNIL